MTYRINLFIAAVLTVATEIVARHFLPAGGSLILAGPAIIPIAAIVTAAAAAGGTAYQIHAGQEARGEAKKQAAEGQREKAEGSPYLTNARS